MVCFQCCVQGVMFVLAEGHHGGSDRAPSGGILRPDSHQVTGATLEHKH